MTGCLLFVILMYSSFEIQVQAPPPPKLTVNPPVIRETDSVTLNCQTPPSVPVHQCYFMTVKPETSKGFSCLKTFTGTELLLQTNQRSPAKVEVKCFYTLMYGDVNSPSSHSGTSSITILNITQRESSISPSKSTFTMTTGVTVSTPYTSTFVTPVRPASGLTGSTPHASTAVKLTSDNRIYTVESRNSGGSFTFTSQSSVKPASETVTAFFSTAIGMTTTSSEHRAWVWKLVIIVAGFGMTVGVILLGLALVCTRRRAERRSYKRTQANITGDVICTRNVDHGGMVTAGDGETHSVIMSLPSADCPSGSEKLNKQASQNGDSDVYHVYSTISEEPPASALKDMAYSTLQAH